jgi:hypothetical protein
VFGEHKKVGLSSEDFRVFLLAETLKALDCVKWNNSREVVDFITNGVIRRFVSGVNDENVPTFRKYLKRILNIRCLLCAGIDTAKLDKLCGGEIDDSSESDEQDESVTLSASAASCKKSKLGTKRELEELAKLNDIFKAVGSESRRLVVRELQKMLTAGEAIPAISTKTLIENSSYNKEKLKLRRARLDKSIGGISKALNNAYFQKIVSNNPHRTDDESTAGALSLLYCGVDAAMDRVSLKNADQVVAFIATQFKAQLGDGARRHEYTKIISETTYFNGSDDSGKTIDDIPGVHDVDPEGRYLDNLDLVKAQMFLERIKHLSKFFKNPTGKFPKAFENPKRYGAWKKIPVSSFVPAAIGVGSQSARPYEPMDYSFTESGYDYEVEFVKFIDNTRIADTAWSVTEAVLRELIALEWYLGAELTKARAVFGKRLSWENVEFSENGECVVRKQSVDSKLGEKLTQPDLDLALVTLERCADLLEGVLFRHNTKAYILGPADPLSVVRVNELLGLIRAMITLFPGDNNTWEEHERTLPSYWDLVWPGDLPADCEAQELSREDCHQNCNECAQAYDCNSDYPHAPALDETLALDDEALQKIRYLALCAKNAATGYCNTGFALCSLDDERDAAKIAYDASDYLLVSQIYRKVLNQVSGFLKTYLVHSKNGILPIYKGTGHTQWFDENSHKNANALRCKLWEDLGEYFEGLADYR